MSAATIRPTTDHPTAAVLRVVVASPFFAVLAYAAAALLGAAAGSR